ncbi:class I SAM-dependent methyltransferase [candidate division WWE3 bacterium]|nr:class I SAM-dependent methyltransferase [candidate division WWE3 bacterium]
MIPSNHPASFRDPSGFIFSENGTIYRQINHSYQHEFDMLINSGLYDRLVSEKLLIPHQDSTHAPLNDQGYKVIEPNKILCITYPYEWSFQMLKDAAMLTLKIQQIALEYNMSLKDASSYNVQFHQGKPIFIDTLSFEEYTEKPWVAYKQFCQHFLAPLALMAKVDLSLNKMLEFNLDGIPLQTAVAILPKTFTLRPSYLIHLFIHAYIQRLYSDSKKSSVDLNKAFSLTQMKGLIDSLTNATVKISLPNTQTEWGDYYANTNYGDDSFEEKKKILVQLLTSIEPGCVWDIGGNTGVFSLLAAEHHSLVLSSDIDPLAIDRMYSYIQKQHVQNVACFISDITNPSPGIGWMNKERSPLYERVSVDTILALALIHHLAISNNLPFDQIAYQFSLIAPQLIIEFVPKEDTQVQRLLTTRKDIFNQYSQESFEESFGKFYTISQSVAIPGTVRTLYKMVRRNLE